MNIIAKYLSKNIFAKPIRTLILLVCISVCSFVALLSLDITGSIELIIKAMCSQITGSSDIIINDSLGVEEKLALSYDTEQLLVFSREDGTIENIEGIYNYFQKSEFSIKTMDYDIAYKMGLCAEEVVLKSDEAAVTARLKNRNGWDVGTVVTVTDDYGKEHEVKIVQVLSERGVANGQYALFLSKEGYSLLTDNIRANTVYIDAVKDKDAGAISEEIKSTYYNADVMQIMDSEENKEMIKQLRLLFGLIFVVCFLLVIFVAVSVSGRIVCERMSVVGTFRSLGISSSYTAKLLIMENALYGLMGGVIGSLLYSMARYSIFDILFRVDANGVTVVADYGHINLITVAGVIFMSVIIMCACPLKEIIRTSKTPIRDIIFDNKDTAYRFSNRVLIAGIAFMTLAIVTFAFTENVSAQFICFPAIIIAVALLFPWLLKAFAKLIGYAFDRLDKPIAHLAATEIYSRKSTVGSSVLCVTVSALAIIIFIFVSIAGNLYDIETYSCDVIIDIGYAQKPEQFKYVDDIEGVEGTELIYSNYIDILIGGEKKEVNVFGLNEGGYRYFTGIENCPLNLLNNEFVMDRTLADKMGIRIGDEVDITFGEDTFLPITKSLRLIGYIDSYNYDTTSNSVVISKDLFTDMYHDFPEELLVKCSDSKLVTDTVLKYSHASTDEVKTVQEEAEEWHKKGQGMRRILIAIIVLGISLSVIGMVSNQLIGFEGRKRECAVLASVAMDRNMLTRMFMEESMLASGISLVVALPTALMAFIPFKNVLMLLSGAFRVTYDIKLYTMFLLILWGVFTLVAVFPIRQLRKLKIAMQLKYE